MEVKKKLKILPLHWMKIKNQICLHYWHVISINFQSSVIFVIHVAFFPYFPKTFVIHYFSIAPFFFKYKIVYPVKICLSK